MMPLITVAKSQDGQIQPMESRNSKLSVKVEVGPDSLANLLGDEMSSGFGGRSMLKRQRLNGDTD